MVGSESFVMGCLIFRKESKEIHIALGQVVFIGWVAGKGQLYG